MIEQEIKQMISTHALGCLNKEDLLLLREALAFKGPEEMEELGELQQIVNILPVIMEFESPQPYVKDKIAKKLIKISRDIKEKSTGTHSIPKMDIEELPTPVQIEQTPPILSVPIPPLEREETEQTLPRPEYVNPRTPLQIQETPSDGKLFKYLTLVLCLFAIAGLVFVYFSFSSVQNSLTEELRKMREENQRLSEKVSKLEMNQRILSLMSAKDLKTVNLNGTTTNPTGFGKLLLAFDSKEGLLQLYNMPRLSENKIYQFWMARKGKYYPLGICKPSKEIEYLYINQMPDASAKEVDSFFLTAEKGQGAYTPSSQVYLLSSSYLLSAPAKK